MYLNNLNNCRFICNFVYSAGFLIFSILFFDLRPNQNKFNILESKEINNPTISGGLPGPTLLNFCIDQGGEPFAFSLNGNPIGESLPPDQYGLPEHIYQGYILSLENEKTGIFLSGSGYTEHQRTFFLNGVFYKILISRFPLPDGGKATALVSIRDITSLRDNTGDVNLDEILPGLVAGNMTDVFYIFDTHRKLIYLSPSFEKLSGYTAEEIMKSSFGDYITAETRQAPENYFNKLYRLKEENHIQEEDKELKIFEVQIITRSQALQWAEISVAPYIDRNNKIKGIYGMIRNISGQKQIQEEIQTSLQFEIERSNIKSKYISSVSHEFRTPLSIIYSNLQLLESHLPELDTETIADSFNLSKLAVKSLLRVLDKITIIDAAGKGKLEFKPLLVDFPILIRDLVKELNEMEIVPGRILVKTDPEIQKVFLDDYLFHHIFSNLLQNAMIYSDKKQFVEFSVSKGDHDFLNLEVKDYGIGIPREDMALIFEPFFRAGNSGYSKGSGLGLAVVNECLKLHQGTISIDSQIGTGTTVLVRLPVAQMKAGQI